MSTMVSNYLPWSLLSGLFLYKHGAYLILGHVFFVHDENSIDFNLCCQLLNKNDPNISSCPAEHPFIFTAKLEAEGQKLLEGLTNTLYTSQWVTWYNQIYPHYIFGHRDVDLLSAMLNSWATLVKQRPSTLPYLITALRTWNPAALTGLPASSIKSVEKAVRILLAHLSRCVAVANISWYSK